MWVTVYDDVWVKVKLSMKFGSTQINDPGVKIVTFPLFFHDYIEIYITNN